MSNYFERIDSLLNQADLYRSQGLFRQSESLYLNAQKTLEKTASFSERERIVNTVKQDLNEVRKELLELDQANAALRLPKSVQDLIKEKFSFSTSRDSSKVEGALALIEFGQYEEALEEFFQLLDKGSFPVLSAKNIIRCYMGMSLPDVAIEQFKQWILDGQLREIELKLIKEFLETVLIKKGIKSALPYVGDPSFKIEDIEKEADDPSIYSAVVYYDDECSKKNRVEFDVIFKTEDTITLMIPADLEYLLGGLAPGKQLYDIQLYCPLGILRDNGTVCGMTEVKFGPRRGDYIINVRVQSN